MRAHGAKPGPSGSTARGPPRARPTPTSTRRSSPFKSRHRVSVDASQAVRAHVGSRSSGGSPRGSPASVRDSFAVDLLSRGASPYDVAKLLGGTIEKHYAPFVRELRERARRIMESGEGLEITGTPRALQKPVGGKIN